MNNVIIQIMNLLQATVGRDDNGMHDDGRWVSWLKEDDVAISSLDDEEIAAMALVAGYQVFKSDYGYFGDEDYLIVRPGYDVKKLLNEWASDDPTFVQDEVDAMIASMQQIKSLKDF